MGRRMNDQDSAESQVQADLLSRYVDENVMLESFRKGLWREEFPSASHRREWEALLADEQKREWCGEIVRRAEETCGDPWPECSLSQWFDYMRKGLRTPYETPYFKRRFMLSRLVAAECIERSGRFLPKILEGIWTLISEPIWTVPSHCAYEGEDPFPKPGIRVDLFASQTGGVLGDTLFLLGEDLRGVSREFFERVRREVEQRVILPVLSMEEGEWWLDGFNNWTPWCSYNVISAAAGCGYASEDPEGMSHLCMKLVRACDRFIARYKPDGACDEGPSYWGVAGRMLLLFVNKLRFLCDEGHRGQIERFFREPLIQRMAEYFPDANICGDWFVNPADASPKFSGHHPAEFFYFGRLSGSEKLVRYAKAFLAARRKGHGKIPSVGGNTVSAMLINLLWTPSEVDETVYGHEPVVFFKDAQIMIVRQHSDGSGTAAAIKGGHNGESHNHNDIGQFWIFNDGEPVIVDPGNRTYTRETFSPRRYNAWHISALGHNAARFNGKIQTAGSQFYAQIEGCSDGGANPFLSLDLSRAYPEDAGICKYIRKLSADMPSGAVTVSEQVSSRLPLKIEISLYTPTAPVVSECGEMLEWAGMRLSLSGIKCTGITKVVESDGVFMANWRDGTLFRLDLYAECSGSASWNMAFTRI